MENNHPFSRIAGYAHEKKSLMEISTLMKQSELLVGMGIRLPHGVLLLGDPGVGKTVLAEALIADGGLPCVRIDPESLENDGVALSAYLQTCAEKAKEQSPCILFADELDKLVGVMTFRGGAVNMEATRAFLRMIDELKNSNVVVIAVANDSQALNRAIIRSGRFDRVIHIAKPGSADRKAIFRHYAKGKPISGSVSFEMLAQLSTGMTGADIECVMNEAGLHAVGCGRKRIAASDVSFAIENKRFLGVAKESELSAEDQRVVALHEAGHALVTWVLQPSELASVTVLPIGESLGHVSTAHGAELPTLSQATAQLAIYMAGRAAERLFYPNETFLGAGSDYSNAFRTAFSLLTEEGIAGTAFIHPEAADPYSGCDASEGKKRMIEEEVGRMLAEAERRAYCLLDANRETLQELAERLMKVKTMSHESLYAFLSKFDTVDPDDSHMLPEAAELDNAS